MTYFPEAAPVILPDVGIITLFVPVVIFPFVNDNILLIVNAEINVAFPVEFISKL